MPRLVDHASRRAEIIQATWRSIAAHGIEATTMRGLARELGLANGSVTHYFPHKKAILAAAFEHVFAATTARYEAIAASENLRGLAALRAFLVQTLPMDEERLLEARIVIPFLEHAAIDADMATLFRTKMDQWQQQLSELIAQARADGEVPASLDTTGEIDLILHAITGVQAIGVLLPETARGPRLTAMLDILLSTMGSRTAT
ncbi:TetR/AcrR family transcriptional regulator [Microbacterium sp. NPDC077184]|uniref:TetR/AcrR family transcriptional regulator n=1 Tax=Microbacterium sp. NPDC077184 TaxID=3154764 RepID=UPI00341C98C7